ncbi:translation initiation factor IF-2 [Candidatus Woesearchaeota archaeon]|nr:translation initiation factor IF-2 [Candidatus Woesearchaeota archaeon]
MAKTRSPICVVVGHVDHGKSSLLDYIRGTTIVETEAGRITQAIGASIVPMDTIKRLCGGRLSALKMAFTIPGLLFIDTPGHAAFASLRKRGGNIADIAIVVVDINEGFKPQTIESIEILKTYKTPFVVAANKIDLIPSWKTKTESIIDDINGQDPKTLGTVETRLYELVARLSELGFQAERFDRVEDYTKQVGIIPLSAITGEGVPELLMVIAGLAQRFLEQGLRVDAQGCAKGTLLEVKEEKGLGKTVDVIIYDGTIKVNDTIVIGSIDKPIITKVRALFEPAPLAEMRDRRTKYQAVKEASAATGVKISAPELDRAMAGMPLRACAKEDAATLTQEIMKEIEEVVIETDKEGVVIKADTLGSLEALSLLLRQKNIPIKRTGIGPISKKDIADAEANIETEPLYAVVLGFNVKSDIEAPKIKVFSNNVIYRLLDDYEVWMNETIKRKEAAQLDALVRPCKMRIMPGYVFRQSNPAICGVEIVAGKVKAGTTLLNVQGQDITTIKAMQKERENVSVAQEGEQIAMSLDRVTIGRNLHEGDILLADVTEPEFRKLKDLKKFLTDREIDVLKELAAIKRKENQTWGI